jgi:hypothetical protein
MSHFSVLVVGDYPEGQLSPYDEQDMNYSSFVDKTAEVIEEYNQKTTAELNCISANLWEMKISMELFDKLSSMNVEEESEVNVTRGITNGVLNYYKKSHRYEGFCELEDKSIANGVRWFEVTSVLETIHPDKDICFEGKIIIKKILEPQGRLISEKYKTVEEFATKYHGYKIIGGKFGYYKNPKAKWDWYELGGRWSGVFKLKSGVKDSLEDEVYKTGYADQALKKDIDFEEMGKERLKKTEKTYRGFRRLLKKDPERAVNVSFWDYGILNIGDKDNFIPETRKSFLKRRKNFSTFAVLKDGIWYEKGEMLWWTFVYNEKAAEEWDAEFEKLINETPDDTLLSIIDCHI